MPNPNTCPLQMDQGAYDAIRKCEAVVIREMETPGGDRYAYPLWWGDKAKMDTAANTPRMIVVPDGVTWICDKVVLVKDLIPPHHTKCTERRKP